MAAEEFGNNCYGDMYMKMMKILNMKRNYGYMEI